MSTIHRVKFKSDKPATKEGTFLEKPRKTPSHGSLKHAGNILLLLAAAAPVHATIRSRFPTGHTDVEQPCSKVLEPLTFSMTLYI